MVIRPAILKKAERPKLELGKPFWIFFEIVIVLIIMVLGLGLYSFVLDGRIQSLQKEIDALEKERDVLLEKEIKKKLLDFEKAKPILENQVSATSLFSFLEKNTLANVRFSKLTFEILESDLEKNKLIIDLSSLTYYPLLEQIAIYRAQSEVKNVKLTGVSSTDLGPVITLEINFFPDKILKSFR